MRVELTTAGQRDIDGLPIAIHHRVIEVLERLEKWPAVSGVKHLRGDLAGHARIRTGSYRVVFTVTTDKIRVWKIDNRKDVYR